MKRLIFLLPIVISIFCLVSSPQIALPQEKPPTREVYFSPKGGCTEAIIKELDKPKNKIMKKFFQMVLVFIPPFFLEKRQDWQEIKRRTKFEKELGICEIFL